MLLTYYLDSATGISRGQALVRFDDLGGSAAAVSSMDNYPFPVHGNVKPMSVRFADTEEEKADST